MNDTNYLYGALDFALKYEATRLTIETDNGILDMTPREALDEFEALYLGDSFTLRAIHFDNN